MTMETVYAAAVLFDCVLAGGYAEGSAETVDENSLRRYREGRWWRQ